MENLTFVYFQPILISIVVLLILLSLFLLLKKNIDKSSKISCIIFSVIALYFSGLLIIIEGTIIDELNLKGDQKSFYLSIFGIGISIINLIIAVMKKNGVKH
ncbi:MULTISPECIES: hypothetical protein [Bacilli]|uniref:Group-specific protein n=1 Tax=Bacillus cereus TaxID=1396 RepID=A0A9X5ZCD0_BACCE|nr:MULTISPECIES: hypothetical protein [Bacilli]MDV8116418.1 hypothetical protein [Bacillus sp. BAU-SS-2023]MCT6909735.1 hypothetical protein [Bacillus cereus]MCX2467371.1 hypothetical protein [Bacillus sp. AM01]MDA3674487.1 hypothetical protein [Streptococcus thermophilus]NKW77694.1 hypothetical protein [Bacillus cereus]